MIAATKGREALRFAGALVMAVVGGAVAMMVPSAVTQDHAEPASVVWRVGAVCGVAACLLVAGSAAVFLLRERRKPGLVRAAAVLGWVTVLGLVLGGIYGVLTDVPASDAVGMSFIVAIPAAGAVLLAWTGDGLVGTSDREHPADQ